jgi:rubrerythrin
LTLGDYLVYNGIGAIRFRQSINLTQLEEEDDMRPMTEENLSAAFAGESQAHMKYKSFAAKASKDGFANVSRLFTAISFAEQVHATTHFRTLGHIQSTSDNLQAAIDGENYEVTEMYPSFIVVAENQQEKGAVKTETWALEAEKIHAGLYSTAKQAVDGGADFQVGEIQICSVCGWTGTGAAPDRCPVCNAKKEFFRVF